MDWGPFYIGASMKKSFLFPTIFSLLIILGQPSYSSELFHVDENSLIEAIEQNGVPEREQVFAEYFGAESEKLSALDKLEFKFNSELSYLKSDETSFSALKPATEQAKSFKAGIEKPTSYGVNFGIKYLSEQFSAGTLHDATNSRVFAELSADLYKNLFGMVTRNQLNALDLYTKEAELLKKIRLKGLRLKIRKLYWDFVAANEAYNVAKKLEESAKNQIKDILDRKKSGIADSGDLARFNAQLTERKAQVIHFKANQSIIIAKIKELIPELQGKSLRLKPYNLKESVNNFYACLNVISKHKEVPQEFTLYDDIINLQKERFELQKRVTNSYNKMDLVGYVQKGIDGKDNSVSGANDDMLTNKRDFYATGIKLNIPLGNSLNKTYEAKANLDYSTFIAKSKAIDLKLTSFHETIVETINLLRTVIDNRVDNIKHSWIGLNDSKKKYRQARITSQQLVHEEDQYLANSLKLIDVENYVIKVMFDYFTLFTETPCKLN